jgi:hypothetical protein
MRVTAGTLRKVTFAALMILFSERASAALTGNELREICNKSESSRSYAECRAFVMAIADLMSLKISLRGWLACIPQGVTYEQATIVTRKSLEQNPELLHLTAANLVAIALAEAFPCPAQ